MTRNTRQLDLLIANSNRAKSRMVFWLVVSITGTFASVVVWMQPKPAYTLFGFTVAMMVCGFLFAVIEAFSYARYNGLMWEFFEPPEDDLDLGQPRRDPPNSTNMLTSETRPPTGRLFAPGEPNQLLVGRYKDFTERHWMMLYNAIDMYGGLVSRDESIKASGVFTAAETGLPYSQSGVWPQFRDELRRLKAISKQGGSWYLTPQGRVTLADAAGKGVVT